MAMVAGVVAVVVGCWVLAARPHRIPVPMSAQSALAAGSSPPISISPGGSLTSPVAGSATSSASPELVVDVVGKVHRPGLYRLPAGSRVDDAVVAAGGVLAGVDPLTVNLARKLADGEQLAIGLTTVAPVPPGSQSSTAGDPAGTGSAAGPIDLNAATAAQLDTLPGVGPVLAQRIVDWRTQHGRFDSVDQLQDVSGIGDAKFADLKSLVRAG